MLRVVLRGPNREAEVSVTAVYEPLELICFARHADSAWLRPCRTDGAAVSGVPLQAGSGCLFAHSFYPTTVRQQV